MGEEREEPSGAAPGTAEAAFVERLAGVFIGAGMPRLPSRVLSAVMCSPTGALTAADLTASLQSSAGGISGAVRYLLHTGLLRREHVPGSRRERYRMLDENWYQVYLARSPVVDQLIDVTAQAPVTFGPDSYAGRVLAETNEFFVFLRTELAGVLQRWAERQRDVGGRELTRS